MPATPGEHPLAEDLRHILRHTGPLWPALRGSRFFITGGTGFVGTWLLETLAWANDQFDLNLGATVLSRDPEGFARRQPRLGCHPAFTWQRGDVRDFSFPAGSFTHIIHAAAETSVLAASRPGLLRDSIVQGTGRTLEFAAQSNAEAVLFISSGAVYGKQPAEIPRVPEDFLGPLDPKDQGYAYAEGKRQAERLCDRFSRDCGLPVKTARCFAFVGPHLPLDAHFAIGNFIRDAALGRAIAVRGDGTALRSYLYAADLAIWLFWILLRGERGRSYNVGSDAALSIRELADRVVATLAPELQVQVLGKPTGATPDRYVPCIERARRELELEPWTPLDEAIRKTCRWAQTEEPGRQRLT